MTIYLDNSATTPVRQEVFQAMSPYLTEHCGNPSSIHKHGRRAKGAIETARQQVAALIGAHPSEIHFAPCGTYANNIALLGRAQYVEANGLGRHIITTCIEHSSSLGPAKALQARGWKMTLVHVDDEAVIDLEELERSITDETSIISVMTANNEVGTLQPIEKIAEIAQGRRLFFHSDAIQAAGKVALNVKSIPLSTMSISGHKMNAPKGIGALYVRSGTELAPIIIGGGQERGMFPGTENPANIVAMGAAAHLAKNELEHTQQRLRRIQERMLETLLHETGARLTGAHDLSKRLPGHISVIVDGAMGEDMVLDADIRGVCISSVSACSQAGGAFSHVLKCIGLPEEAVTGSARITAGHQNSDEECQKASEILRQIFLRHSKRQAKPPTMAARA